MNTCSYLNNKYKEPPKVIFIKYPFKVNFMCHLVENLSVSIYLKYIK